MCLEMAAGICDQEAGSQKHLRKQLAAIVKSIQWSYAIFWSVSNSQPGGLEWSFGYYNGDIKTRKTTQGMELKADRWGLQRSEQLRDLYLSLSAGDSNQHARRPSASLCPEDLTDLEWYYLVCMSFTFSHGQGLPGRTLSSGNHVWLCNAHYSDSKIFSRSLLAKSATIQTVACFPLVGGVLEMGTTEMVPEDLHLVEQVMDFHKCIFTEASLSMQNIDEDENHDPNAHHEMINDFVPDNLNLDGDSNLCKGSDQRYHLDKCYAFHKGTGIVDNGSDEHIGEELKTESPDSSSNDYCLNQHIDVSLMSEGFNCTSQVQNWQFMEDVFSNCLHLSTRSNHCLPQFMGTPKRITNSCIGEKIHQHAQNVQECKNSFSSFDVENDDSHYRRTLSAIFKAQNRLVVPNDLNALSASCFTIWRKDLDVANKYSGVPQRMLKSILLNVASMHTPDQEMSMEEAEVSKTRKATANHVPDQISPERREKLNEKFLALRSLVPSVGMVEQTSILGDAISYLKELERRIEELESNKELIGHKTRTKRTHPDVSEGTSDNYNNGTSGNAKFHPNKRKACDMDETDGEGWNLLTNGMDVSVTIMEKEVVIQMQCPWRECLLLEIMDAISNLHLDAHSVQSSTTDGLLSLAVKSKFRGAVLASPGMIKQTLFRILAFSIEQRAFEEHAYAVSICDVPTPSIQRGAPEHAIVLVILDHLRK